MTKREQEAKIKELTDFMENGVPKEAKTPSSESDNLHVDVIDMKQKYEEMNKEQSGREKSGR